MPVLPSYGNQSIDLLSKFRAKTFCLEQKLFIVLLTISYIQKLYMQLVEKSFLFEQITHLHIELTEN